MRREAQALGRVAGGLARSLHQQAPSLGQGSALRAG